MSTPYRADGKLPGKRRHNDYARIFGASYQRIPKAVFAAVALSYANRIAEGGEGADYESDPFGAALREFFHEWRVLNTNGIVPQNVPNAYAGLDFGMLAEAEARKKETP